MYIYKGVDGGGGWVWAALVHFLSNTVYGIVKVRRNSSCNHSWIAKNVQLI